LDKLDSVLLAMLAENCRASLHSLSEKLGMPQTTLYSRIKKLIHKGIIKRYTIDIDYEKLGFEITAIIHIITREGKIRETALKLSEHPNIIALYDITGEYDLLLIARFRRIKELDEFVKWLNSLETISRTVTSIVLKTVKEDHNSILRLL